MRSRRRSLVVAASFLALLACGRLFSTSVRAILDNPAAYEGKTVTLEGDVVDATNVVVLKFYHLEDATGRIVVVARSAVPARGAHVKVRGTVHQAFALGDQTLTVVLEEP